MVTGQTQNHERPGVPDPKVNHPGNITIYVARKKCEYDLEAVQYAPGSSITSTSTRSGAAGNAHNTWTAPREVPIRWIDRGFCATSPLGHNTRGALPGTGLKVPSGKIPFLPMGVLWRILNDDRGWESGFVGQQTADRSLGPVAPEEN